MQFDTLPACSHALVALRPMVPADRADWYAVLSIPAVVEHTSWKLSSAADLDASMLHPGAVTASTPLRFAIVSRADGAFIGSAGFHTVWPEHRSAELAYDLAPPWWGRGIATDVCTTLVAWAYAHAGVVRIQAAVLDSNVRSAHVLRRCGFAHEGRLRSYRVVRGQSRDFDLYAHVADQHRG